jgi:thiamine-monophosphate kinase
MDSADFKVSNIGEKGLIKKILSKSQKILNDDGAIINIKKNEDLIASSDMLIQSKHFPKEMSYYQMGFKSVTVNVSDLAAMGSKPLGFLLNIAIYKDLLVKDFDEIIKGVLDACNFYDIPLIGGDTNEANEIIISGTALGLNEKNKSLMKYGFNKGDLVCISGNIGLAALGFELLDKNLKIDTYNLATEKALFPIAKINEGLILKKIGASSLTDITDGLASELYDILDVDKKFSEKNGLNFSKGIMIYEDKLNVDEKFKKIVKSLNLNYLDLLLHTGEDFELLFTISPDKKEQLEKDMDFIVIGEINDSSKIEITLINGKVSKLSSKGYEHLK